MAKKVSVYSAGEAPNKTLVGNTTINADSYDLNGYPITFGVGEGSYGTLATIADKYDGKIRFVYNVQDSSNITSDSGAIYVENKLVSSKILDIKTDAVIHTIDGVEVVDTPAKNVTVKYIDGYDIKTLTFGVVDSTIVEALAAKVGKLETWAKSEVITATDGGAVTVTTSTNKNGFKSYKVGVNVDEDSVKIIDNKLAVAKYEIKKLAAAEQNKNFAAQYQLMSIDPSTGQSKAVGDTINIMKDFLLKSAHVCVFNKNADGTDYDGSADQEITTVEVYAAVKDPAYADITLTDSEGNKIYLENAPVDKGLYIGHTYLHLILNTIPTDEVVGDDTDLTEGNDTSTDVYLDFTEIMDAASFQEIIITIKDHEARLSKIEEGYINSIIEELKTEGSQFNTVTITKASGDISTYATTETTFDIPNQTYYNAVDSNFTTLQENDKYLAGLLAWTGLE